jgi:transcriptional regulator with XRE-family HTH domain
MKKQKQNETEYLRELVEKTGNTYAEVTDYLGVNERTLYRWLSGESRIPYSVIRALELLTAPK